MNQIIIDIDKSIPEVVKEDLRKHIVSLCYLLSDSKELMKVTTDEKYNSFGGKK